MKPTLAEEDGHGLRKAWKKPTLFVLHGGPQGGKNLCASTEVGYASDTLTTTASAHGTVQTGKSCMTGLPTVTFMVSPGHLSGSSSIGPS